MMTLIPETQLPGGVREISSGLDEADRDVLGGVREISKILSSGLDEADRDAFSHYAVDWLEESAGICCLGYTAN